MNAQIIRFPTARIVRMPQGSSNLAPRSSALEAQTDRVAEILAERARKKLAQPVDKHARLLELAELLAQRNRELDSQGAGAVQNSADSQCFSPVDRGGTVLRLPKARVVRNKRQQREATAALHQVRQLYPGIADVDAWRRIQQAERVAAAIPQSRRKP